MTDFLTNEKQAVPARPAEADLSKEMEQSMERQPDERIKVVWVFDDFYRCNWWVEDWSCISKSARSLRIVLTGMLRIGTPHAAI